MANRKTRKSAAGRPRKIGAPRSSSRGERDTREGDALVEATHQVVEDEIHRGDTFAASDPDQKGEPGSRI
jgi:hypothetical protein